MADSRPLRLLVVTAHPADAFDNAAGTIAKHAKRGDEVQLACVTHGARSHAPNLYGDKQQRLDDEAERELLEEIIRQKKIEFEDAARAVGISRTHWLAEEDEPYVLSKQTVYDLSEIYREARPDILITHHPTERNHHDHPVVGDAAVRAAVTAARWLKGSRREPAQIATIYFFGTQDRRDSTLMFGVIGLPASHVVDITDTIEEKKASLACFGTQKYLGASYNSPEYINRRIEALEGYWGLMNGPRYAEEFIAAQPQQAASLPTFDGRVELPK
jgi:4-oxalomesaconate hydratase